MNKPEDIDIEFLSNIASKYLTAVGLENFQSFIEAGELQLALELLADWSIEYEVEFNDEERAYILQRTNRGVYGS